MCIECLCQDPPRAQSICSNDLSNSSTIIMMLSCYCFSNSDTTVIYIKVSIGIVIWCILSKYFYLWYFHTFLFCIFILKQCHLTLVKGSEYFFNHCWGYPDTEVWNHWLAYLLLSIMRKNIHLQVSLTELEDQDPAVLPGVQCGMFCSGTCSMGPCPQQQHSTLPKEQHCPLVTLHT